MVYETTPFDQAWDLLKRIPVYPIGVHDNKKVVMYAGKPYYQSTGSSGSPVQSDNPLFDPTQDKQRAYKVPGGWYGFQGIDTQNEWGQGGGWWAKGEHDNLSPHTNPIHAQYRTDETGKIMIDPEIHGSAIANYVNDPNNQGWMQWDDISANEMNRRLTENHNWPGVIPMGEEQS